MSAKAANRSPRPPIPTQQSVPSLAHAAKTAVRPPDDRQPWRPPSPQARRTSEELDQLLADDLDAAAEILVRSRDGTRYWLSFRDLVDEIVEAVRGAA
jgi:hypothetical protein